MPMEILGEIYPLEIGQNLDPLFRNLMGWVRVKTTYDNCNN